LGGKGHAGGLPALLAFNLSTTWWTSAKHHFPFGFLFAHWQFPNFFSVEIFSIIRERPLLRKSFSISAFVYSKQ
jgi:hypothetical protein